MRTFLLFLLVSACSCNGTTESGRHVHGTAGINDSVVQYNQWIVREESQEIDDYAERHHWNMEKTETGLRYMIYKRGIGIIASPGNTVMIRYTINLLNGDLVFKPDSVLQISFTPGKRKVVSGLEEGVMLMRQGDRAKLIVPSHLAFGLLGDLEKIPARAVVVYDVELCTVDRTGK